LERLIHELVTNAVKYGALSNDHGALDVRWDVTDGTLARHWSESGGPKVDHLEENGFGYVLIKGRIEQQLGGKRETDFSPDELCLKLEFPL
jgi:two-component sensor histidine kinase